jgi:hypothetical protein
MNRVRHPAATLAVVISLFLVFSQAARASTDVGLFALGARAYYIDPGTGSIIIQVLIGGLVAGVAMMGVYRMRVKAFFGNLFGRRRPDTDGESEESGDND